ncbi:MAG: MBL fold metallo-hydrolase [Robiginitomaculum sp.]|nr:MBL fold metallo-hydrolase [Robiginitomaculum sp.]
MKPIKADPLLDFTDRRDFEAADRGFIATMESGEILDADGNVVTSMKAYDFLKQEAPATVNPSLWRQSQLNAKHGLYEVMDGIYQVRGFDLSNMTIIRGDKSWIIVDPLITKEAASAALALANKHLGERRVSAVIFTHSHLDHYGGIRGIVSAEDVQSGKVKIIAPHGFTRETVSENILAGNQMTRRAGYMFGMFLPKSPEGHIGSGLGQGISRGTSGLIPPTHNITETGETLTIDGVEIIFQMAPGAEAPEEFMFYLPQFKAFSQAEEMSRNQHNLLTPRGAQIRNGLVWSKHIDKTIQMFGSDIDVSFGSHHWPTWGNSEVINFFEKQRDTYRYIHDQTLRLANHGGTMIEIAEQLKLPKSLASEFYNRGYYGTVNFNSKAQYQLYYGWFDGNPAHLNPLPPEEDAIASVRYMGGSASILDKAKADYNKGNYRLVASVLNKVMFAEPDNEDAAQLLANTYRHLGYAAESGPWRDFYLTGAQELTGPLPKDIPINTVSADMIDNLPLDLFFDLMAVKLNGPKAEGLDMKINFAFTDTGNKAALHLKNSVLNTRMGSQYEDANATIKLARADLNRIMLKQTDFRTLMKSGDIVVDGSLADMDKFMKLQDDFEYWFNIIRP